MCIAFFKFSLIVRSVQLDKVAESLTAATVGDYLFSLCQTIEKTEHMFYNYSIATLERADSQEMDHMEYKARIIEMLDKATDTQLRRLYLFIKSYLGLR